MAKVHVRGQEPAETGQFPRKSGLEARSIRKKESWFKGKDRRFRPNETSFELKNGWFGAKDRSFGTEEGSFAWEDRSFSRILFWFDPKKTSFAAKESVFKTNERAFLPIERKFWLSEGIIWGSTRGEFVFTSYYDFCRQKFGKILRFFAEIPGLDPLGFPSRGFRASRLINGRGVHAESERSQDLTPIPRFRTEFGDLGANCRDSQVPSDTLDNHSCNVQSLCGECVRLLGCEGRVWSILDSGDTTHHLRA